MSELKKVSEEEKSLVPVKKEEKSLVVVKKKEYRLATIRKSEVIKEVVKKVSLVLIGTISIAYIALMLFVATSVFYVSHLKNGLIQRGVYVNGINISDLTGEEAVNSLASQLNDNIPEYIILKYKDTTYQLNLREINPKFDIESAVDDAYQIGRTQNVVKDLRDYAEVISHTVNIDSNLQYDEQSLQNYINSISDQLPDKVQEYRFSVEKNKLIINRGKSGVELNQEELRNKIIENLKNRKYDEEIEIPIYETLPKDIDLHQIREEIYVEPQDAYFTENPMKIYQEIIGIDFDVEEVQKLIDNSPDKAEYQIDLTLTNPNVFVKDLNIFPDMLSTFSTNYVNNPNRTTNLILASNKISGIVIMPGEKFSFNEVVGERTVAAGYKNAAIFVNGQVEDGLAGGICQVSSTLYDAVIGANLQIDERHNHSKLTSYLPGGKDATVVWGRYDFQFTNNREYPIKIEMSVQGGVITAQIFGIKTAEEYDITIESGRAGIAGAYSVYNAYKVYRQNGVEIKREFLSRDLYK